MLVCMLVSVFWRPAACFRDDKCCYNLQLFVLIRRKPDIKSFFGARSEAADVCFKVTKRRNDRV